MLLDAGLGDDDDDEAEVGDAGVWVLVGFAASG